jgi:signal transduction histidine kinase
VHSFVQLHHLIIHWRLEMLDRGQPAEHESALDVDRLVERLSRHRTIGAAPTAELRWLVANGEIVNFAAGDPVAGPTAPVQGMYILLSGHIAIYQVLGPTRHKLTEWGEGDVTGMLPYSRLVKPPGETVVEQPTEALLIRSERLRALAKECYEVTAILVHLMLDRTRFFTSAFLHDEKLKSLGKLAAGLAHELNNPAAAIARFADALPDSVGAAESAARAVGAAGLTDGEVRVVADLIARCDSVQPRSVRSPLEEAEREDQMADWLEARGLDAARADALALSPLTIGALDQLAGALRGDVLETALHWVASHSTARGLAREIRQAAVRISDLVTAVRGFTRVDAAAVPQPVDVGEGLAQTLAVVRSKARAKSIRITVDVEAGTPTVRGVGAELNQVWANLIDNALDAAPRDGSVQVIARVEGGAVAVRVIDDGPGIPPDVRDRIFDPFFTTKDVGQGTGLGLDIVRRLVARHNGDIEVQSRPGRTEFIVSLPAADGDVRLPGAEPGSGGTGAASEKRA